MRRERLTELAAQLGETPSAVARTLREELDAAQVLIDAGLATGDGDAVARASHAARNSLLMLDEARTLAALRGLDDAVAGGDEAAARRIQVELASEWSRLRGELDAAAADPD